jgi:hypothetical protein
LATFANGRVELPRDDRLVAQLVGLERRTARGGRDSIDHPPGGHDDRANAVAGLLGLLRHGGAAGFVIETTPGIGTAHRALPEIMR